MKFDVYGVHCESLGSMGKARRLGAKRYRVSEPEVDHVQLAPGAVPEGSAASMPVAELHQKDVKIFFQAPTSNLGGVRAALSRIEELEREFAELKKDRAEYKRELSKTNSKLSETNSKLSETNSKLSEMNSKLSEMNRELSKMNRELSEMSKEISDVEYCTATLEQRQDRLAVD